LRCRAANFYHLTSSCDSESLMVAESGKLSKSGLGAEDYHGPRVRAFQLEMSR
jgi:hypothetical protein